jgi:hypothetical protein
MATKPQQKGAQPRMHKLMIRLPAELYERLRVHAFTERTSMAKVVTELLDEKLKKGGKK